MTREVWIARHYLRRFMHLPGDNHPIIALSDDYLVGKDLNLNRILFRQRVVVNVIRQNSQYDCGDGLFDK